ncbi:tetratricopeptide repeat protein [bacterium]|nr:tetratricopeptide repeat protein [bacterium]
MQNLLTSLAKNNKDIEVKKELAYQYHKKNDYKSAIKYYDEILKEIPDNYDVKANKALALHALKHYDDAISIYEELLAVKENDRLSENLVSAYISKGDTLLMQAKYKDSIEPFERAIMRDKNQSYAYYGLAKAYELTGNYDLALVNYEKALEIEPD